MSGKLEHKIDLSSYGKLKNLCVEINVLDLRYKNHYPLGLSPRSKVTRYKF
jgi:hypothetical protein